MVRDELKALFQQALTAAQNAGAIPALDAPVQFDVLHPKQAEHGDYSVNAAMVIAAAARKAGANLNPRQVAQIILDHLPASPLVGASEIAGPGFVNLRLADGWLQQQVAEIVDMGDQFGDSTRGAGQRWQVEYVSANPTGPIHYGGARNAVLGESVVRVLEAAGYTVQREYYVNDGGSQFEKFAHTLYARYMQLFGHEVAIPEDGYPGEYMIHYAQRVRDQQGDAFVHRPADEAIAAIKPLGRAIVLEDLEGELASIGVRFDNWFSEMSLYDDGLVQQSLDYLDGRGELYQKDGATWFRASAYPGIEQDWVLVRSTGAPTYLTGDIAYHYDKFIRRGFDHVIDVLAVDHQGHVPRLKAICMAMGVDPERLTCLLYDLVKLVRDGKEVKISKRAGNLVTIRDVVDEVGSDALHFNLLSRTPESVIEFDLDLAVAQNSENPVYYVQYSHARICSMMIKAQAEGIDLAQTPDLALLEHASEFALIRKLLELEEQIDAAVDRLSPHNLVHYAIDLTKTFNGFYRDCRVVDADAPALSRARLQLCEASRIGLAKTLRLLGVSSPESM